MDERMKTRIQNMALRTWDYIGGDSLRALEDDGQPPVMPKEHVIEVVCDASYMFYHGGDKEAYEAWNKLPTYKEKKAVVEPAFLSTSYGW